MNKEGFRNWLKDTCNLNPSSIGVYVSAVNAISKELKNYGFNETDLYKISDRSIINSILNNPKFIEKNNKNHRRLSNGLTNFKGYMEYFKSQEHLQAELIKEEMEFEKYLVKNPADVRRGNIDDKPKGKPNHRKVNNIKIWIRNPRYASDAVAGADYLCEFNNQHEHFISKFNGENYVEAHHLIPMQYQDQFDCSLDIHANIVSICLVCHKKIHFGKFEDKKDIIDKLFFSRRERLIKSGINISLDQLNSYYQD